MRNGKVRTRAILASLWMLAVAAAHGQPASPQPFALPAESLHAQAAAMPKRDDFAAAFLVEDHHFELDERERLTYRSYRVYRIDSEAAVVLYGQVQAQWDPSRQQRPEIRARVITTDGREHPFDPATLGDETAEGPDPRIFTDERLLRGPLPAVATGSVVEVEVRIVDIEPPFSDGRSTEVFIGPNGPVERTRIVISAPASMPIRHATRLLPDARITEETLDGRRLVTLEHGPLVIDFRDLEFDSMGDQPVWPQFIFSTGESWEAVASGYAGMAEPFVRIEEVRALLPSRLPDSREAKIATLLELLQDRVRYASVLFGTGKLVPSPPSVTLKRRFGDCKDMSVALATLLRAVDIPAKLVLLNSGTGVDVNPDLPGISGFNHVIVYVPGEHPLWIDPTNQYMKAGELPIGNRGRRALVISKTGGALLRTPDARPDDQYHFAVREFRLADFGPADLRVTIRTNGSEAESNRRAWTERNAAAEKLRNDILKAAHSAKSIAGFEYSNDATTGQLIYRYQARGVKAGHTYFNEAEVKESFGLMFSRMPFGLLADDETRARFRMGREESDRKPRVRTEDWVFEPFVTEWQLRIVPPTGFRPNALPENRVLELGPARFTSRFERDPAGHIVATIRFDSGSGRYTVEQSETFRSAFKEHTAAFQFELRFEHEADALIRSGDEPGALRRHREFIAAEPGKAIHLLRAGDHMIDYGLVTEARDYARRATRLEPTNALAFNQLGHALELNEAGDRFGHGHDHDGAIQAHREAIRLDPEDHWYHVNLARITEYDADGTRYGPGADLELAIASYRKYLEKNPGWNVGRWSVIDCLWEMRRYEEIAKEAIDLPENSGAHPTRLAARVMTVGAAVALREDSSRGDPATRRQRIERAMQLLWRSRHYDQTRDLLAGLGGEGRAGPGIDASLMPLLQKTVRYENLPDPPATAAGVAESLMRMAILRQPSARDMAPLISSRARWNGETEWLADHLRRVLDPPHKALVRNMFGRREIARDVALSNFEFRESAAPGDLRRVTVSASGGVAMKLYLVPESGGWRILTLAPAWHPIGREVLARIDAGDTVTARALLELVREEMATDENFGKGDWVKQFARALPRQEQDPDQATLRLATLFLMLIPDLAAAGVDDIRAAEAHATTAGQRSAWHWLLYVAAQYADEHEVMIEAVRGIDFGGVEAKETYSYLAFAQRRAGRWQDSERTSRAWFEAQPTEEGALNYLVDSLNAQDRSQEARELMGTLVRRGRSSPSDLNSYAWQALIADSVDDEAVRAAENSFNRQSRQNFPAGHTLACAYAVSGRETEARDLTATLLKEYPQVGSDNDNIWLTRGLIFERLGETAAALRAYGKLEAPKYPAPGSSFAIASARAAKLKGK